MKWDDRFFEMACLVSTWSKDPTRRVGAVVVAHDLRALSIGYNGFPRGVDDSPERLADPETRLALSVHAERNAMAQAIFPMEAATLYASYFPCHECMKDVVQNGLTKVVTTPVPDGYGSKWKKSWTLALDIAREGGVRVEIAENWGIMESNQWTARATVNQ